MRSFARSTVSGGSGTPLARPHRSAGERKFFMRIQHLIGGSEVESKDYFQTVNPATQAVLAEVARGGEAQITAAVAAAKEAFPGWAGLAAADRAKLIRKLGDL